MDFGAGERGGEDVTLLLALKRLACALGLGPQLTEFCEDCGRETDLVWWAPDALWFEFTDGHGCRCTACFDRAAYARGAILRWRPEIEHRRDETAWP